MLNVLDHILCWIKQIGAMVLNALIGVVNLIVDGLTALAQAAINALPEMDPPPNFAAYELPGGATLGSILGWINYVWPIGTFLTVLATVFALQVALWLANIVLRAVKAVE